MSKINIFINVSDIAAFIGQNKYDYVTPFERLWKKCDKDVYGAILQKSQKEIELHHARINDLEDQKYQLEKRYKNKEINKKEFTLQSNIYKEDIDKLNNTIDTSQKAVKSISLSQKEQLAEVLSPDVMEQLSSDKLDTDIKKKNVSSAIDSLAVSGDVKDKLRKESESFINKTHGTLLENDAIAIFENKFNVKLDTSQAFNKKRLEFNSSTYNWFICGKVDGIYKDASKDCSKDYIVEVKNRTKSFFASLRDYEKTQIQLYMWMLNIGTAKLVEKKNNQIRVTHISFDPTYITYILEGLKIFINNFQKDFLNSYDAKEHYFHLNQESKKLFLYSLYMNEINSFRNAQIRDELPDDMDCMIDSD